MKFHSTLDELQHWLGLLNVDVSLGVNRRHLLSTARLCWLLVDKLTADPKLDSDTFARLEIQLSDLQRAIDAHAQISKPSPKARRVGSLRVIAGGQSERPPSGPERR